MDDVFDALAHPTRRLILDLLNRKDGRTLGDIERHLTLTRFGTMKHLRQLEAAGLITTRKVGREKFHHLNVLPLQEVADRWISRYARPIARAMADLKATAEGGSLPMTETPPRHVYEMYVQASAEAVWAVLTDDARTPLWQNHEMTAKVDWRVGGTLTYFLGDRAVIVGEIEDFAPPRRLVHRFGAQWSPEVAVDRPSRVTWEITPLDATTCRVTVVHDEIGRAHV